MQQLKGFQMDDQTKASTVSMNDGMEILGLDKSGFFYYVTSGQVKSYSTSRRTEYDYMDILAVKEKRALRQQRQAQKRAAIVRHPKKSVLVEFIRVTPDQMPEMVPVLESVFTGSPNVERWQSWIRRNPDIAYMLKVDGRVVGVGLIVPLAQKKIEHILSQQVTPPTDSEEILLYAPDVSTDLYIRSVGIIATATHAEKRRWAAILVRGMCKVLIDLGSRGVIINKIYSRSETTDGKRILRHMGFTEIASITNHSNYVIDAPTSGLKLIREYNQAFAEWQQRQSGE